MSDIVERLRTEADDWKGQGDDFYGPLFAEAGDEITRLRAINAELLAAAEALRFSAYPAHGSGFVTIVCAGNINALEAAIARAKETT